MCLLPTQVLARYHEGVVLNNTTEAWAYLRELITGTHFLNETA